MHTYYYSRLKECLINPPILAFANPHTPYILDTDCSGVGLGAVLSQTDSEGNEKVVAYYSRTLNTAERKYSVTKQELCALVSAVKHFKPYLYGANFTVRTDHHSLIWLTMMKSPTGMLARWLEILSEYRFDIKHRPGKSHGNCDGLSCRFELGEITHCPAPDQSSLNVEIDKPRSESHEKGSCARGRLLLKHGPANLAHLKPGPAKMTWPKTV